MLSSFNLEQFVTIFIEEAEETLQSVEKLLLSIEESDNVDDEDINNLFRYIHTLKGNSSSIGFNHFSKLAHDLESFLDEIRKHRFKFTKDIGEILIKGYDLLQIILKLEINKKMTKELFDKHCHTYLESINSFTQDEDGNGTLQEKKSGEGNSFGFFNSSKQSPSKSLKNISMIEPDKTQQEVKESDTRSIASTSIRISLDKVDNLMNGIGELVIAMSMLEQYADTLQEDKIKNGFSERINFLRHTIRDLQNSVMSTRMVPMEQVYSKFPKLVRDLAKQLDKEIVLKTGGNDVEIDKAMLEGLNDPLMHLIRNACDHGIESSDERVALEKSKEGRISIGASQSNEQIMITIEDDGKGIDIEALEKKALDSGVVTQERLSNMGVTEKMNLIFEPGLSTAKALSNISGRGVGMDVVHSNIHRLGGSIEVSSILNEGTTVRLLLPLTLAIVDVLNVTVGASRFFLPMSSIIESLQPDSEMIQTFGNKGNEVLMLREEAIPIIRIHELFNIDNAITSLQEGMLIVVRYSTFKIALFIDMFLNQQQVVIKSIEKNFKPIEGFSGASIKGDGTIALILDIAAIYSIHTKRKGLS